MTVGKMLQQVLERKDPQLFLQQFGPLRAYPLQVFDRTGQNMCTPAADSEFFAANVSRRPLKMRPKLGVRGSLLVGEWPESCLGML